MTEPQCSPGSELLPCPFCGADGPSTADTGVYWIRCTSCMVEGAPFDTEAEAIAFWNRRAPAQSAWQPIETAPREQTVLVTGGDAIYPVTACWSGLSDECWWVDGQEDIHVEIGWPTHWMPLPAGPALSSTLRPESSDV